MKKTCEICQIELQDEYSYQGHLQGKKHLKNVARSEWAHSIVQRSIFVSRVPSPLLTADMLLRFFSQFGQIKAHKYGLNHVIIEFATVKPVEYLLSKPIYFNNIKLGIFPRVINENSPVKKGNKNKEPETINNTDELDYKNIKSVFTDNATFTEQLAAFLDIISISDYEIKTRYETTCTKLNEIFQFVFPDCSTHRFGSTVSGLGFKNCDLDIYVDIGYPVCQDNDIKVSRNFVTSASVFADVKRILYAKSKLFTKVVPIPKAKTPIIKFTYIPTNISCDISFKNSLAVYNSQLIKFYLSLDHRLRPTMMILKYWVCNYELRGGDKMSKYALTLLFLFYCQQPSVKLVPPVELLKKACQPKIVEGWQVNFQTNLKGFKQKETDITIPELLHGFFDFYANYNFKLNVICPIDGLSHHKFILNAVDSLPDSMFRYKEYLTTRENAFPLPLTKPMCLQDPNELNHNVTGNICLKYLEMFQKYCEAAAQICINTAKNDYKEFLPSLFSLVIKIKPKKQQNIFFIFYANNSLKVGIPDDFESRADIEDKQSFIADNWFNLTISLVQKYFERVLKLQVQFSSEQEPKQQKVNSESDVHSKSQDKVVMHCTGECCLWRDRRGMLDIDPSLSLLEKEAYISEDIFKALSSKNRLVKIKLDFDCHIIKKNSKQISLIITLFNNDSPKDIFSELSSYVKNKMPYVLTKTLSHMMQFNKKTIDLDL